MRSDPEASHQHGPHIDPVTSQAMRIHEGFEKTRLGPLGLSVTRPSERARLSLSTCPLNDAPTERAATYHGVKIQPPYHCENALRHIKPQTRTLNAIPGRGIGITCRIWGLATTKAR